MDVIRLNRLLVIGAAAAAVLAGAAPATASEARVADGTLRVTATPGEANGVLVGPGEDGALTVSDLSGTLVAGPGCAGDADGAQCTGATSVAIALDDGDDSAAVDSEVRLPTAIDAGAGADYVVGGGGSDTIAARDGSVDAIACGEGQDSVSADPQDDVDRDCERVTTTDPGAPGTTPPGDDTGTGDGAPGSGSDGGAAPGGGTRGAGAARCSSRDSGKAAVCSFRLRDKSLSGTVALQLRTGPIVVATGRGRIVRGVARVRMRVRLPLLSTTYALRVAVQATGRHRLVQRSLRARVYAARASER
jgi:hypothetical protein